MVFYGNPAVEANFVSDLVLVYTRSGATVFPEARYSLWKGDEPDVRPWAAARGRVPVRDQRN